MGDPGPVARAVYVVLEDSTSSIPLVKGVFRSLDTIATVVPGFPKDHKLTLCNAEEGCMERVPGFTIVKTTLEGEEGGRRKRKTLRRRRLRRS